MLEVCCARRISCKQIVVLEVCCTRRVMCYQGLVLQSILKVDFVVETFCVQVVSCMCLSVFLKQSIMYVNCCTSTVFVQMMSCKKLFKKLTFKIRPIKASLCAFLSINEAACYVHYKACLELTRAGKLSINEL